MLANYPDVLAAILNITKIKNELKKILGSTYKDILQSDFIQVDAEMLAQQSVKIRRDITVSFLKEKRKVLVIVIEAKSVKLNNPKSICEQLRMYFDDIYFPKDKDIPQLGITLTKYQQILNGKFVGITWLEIINILHNVLNKNKNKNNREYELLNEYFKFITKVDKSMKYYEKEVLSISAGSTFDLINEYHIHACPNNSSYSYKDSLFITFRNSGGGEMSKLYKIKDIICLSPNNEAQLISLGEQKVKDGDDIDRLLKYIEKRKEGNLKFEKAYEYRFYILSKKNNGENASDENIELMHKPRPKSNNAGGRYYTLSELLSGKKVVYGDRIN
ncbi:MAG: hypothetical protein AB9858_02355 [Acidaminococcaceae bacterium]